MQYDRFQDQLHIWFVWVIANTVGYGLGWAMGELLGRFAPRRLVGRSGTWLAGTSLS
jgi:membrane protein YqaA with SNARE-associated domain